MQRLLSMVQPLFGNWRVIRARLVLDRFDVTGGGLLAAGIAFNALFAIIPLAIFASGVIGILVKDPTSQEAITHFLTGLAPPLASFLDTAIGDLANASTSLTIIGLLGAAWGTTRLYASVELGIQAMFTGVKARSLVAKTLRRAVFIVVIAGLIAASIVAATVGSVVLDRATNTGVAAVVQSAVLFVLPYALAVLAIVVVYHGRSAGPAAAVRPVAAGDRRRRPERGDHPGLHDRRAATGGAQTRSTARSARCSWPSRG